jgi:hypothetical protein
VQQRAALSQLKVAKTSPVSSSHTFSVLSSDAETANLPSSQFCWRPIAEGFKEGKRKVLPGKRLTRQLRNSLFYFNGAQLLTPFPRYSLICTVPHSNEMSSPILS